MSRRPEKTFPPPQRRHTNDKQAHEEIVTLLIIRKMQIKIIMRYPLTPVRMTILQKAKDSYHFVLLVSLLIGTATIEVPQKN